MEMCEIIGIIRIVLGKFVIQLGNKVVGELFLCRWVRTGEDDRDGCAVLMCNGDEGCVFRSYLFVGKKGNKLTIVFILFGTSV
jgi:hypothetical protein